MQRVVPVNYELRIELGGIVSDLKLISGGLILGEFKIKALTFAEGRTLDNQEMFIAQGNIVDGLLPLHSEIEILGHRG